MTISELIIELERIKAVEGDLPVYVRDTDSDGVQYTIGLELTDVEVGEFYDGGLRMLPRGLRL